MLIIYLLGLNTEKNLCMTGLSVWWSMKRTVGPANKEVPESAIAEQPLSQ